MPSPCTSKLSVKQPLPAIGVGSIVGIGTWVGVGKGVGRLGAVVGGISVGTWVGVDGTIWYVTVTL